MKKTNQSGYVSLVIILIIVILATGGGIYIYNKNRPSIATTATSTPVVVDNATTSNPMDNGKSGIECFNKPKYFVIEKNKDGELGSDIIVRLKTDSKQVVSCEYVVEEGDFENTQGMNYMMIVNDFVILDSGSSPDPRGMHVYDLKTKKEVFRGTYSRPVDIVSAGEVVAVDQKYYAPIIEARPIVAITYWTPANIEATPKNCVQLAIDPKRDSRDFYIEQKVALSLSTWAVTNAGESRCEYSQ